MKCSYTLGKEWVAWIRANTDGSGNVTIQAQTLLIAVRALGGDCGDDGGEAGWALHDMARSEGL